MKIIAVLFALISSTAFAQINDFECEFEMDNGNEYLVEVPRFHNGGVRNIQLTETTDENRASFNYFATTRFDRAFRVIRFWGGQLNLEISLWPDTRPWFGRAYSSDIRVTHVNNGDVIRNIECVYLGF